MNKIIALKDNFTLQIIPDTWEKDINVCLIDEVNDTVTKLATWKGGKWTSESPIGMGKMFDVIKRYPKVKRLIKETFKELKESTVPQTKTITRTWNCFHRRVNVKIHNIIK
jgi:hypothetical protein